MSSHARRCIHAISTAACLGLLHPAYAADTQFSSGLDPAPMTMATRGTVAGSGSITAHLGGNKLTVQGNFAGLASPATGAHLRAGVMTGVPGDAFADLTVTGAESGTLSGDVTLDRARLKALLAGAVYVQIDSVKAPDGTLRGWLLPPQDTRP
jgi:CHRD domain